MPQKVYAVLMHMENGLINKRPVLCKFDKKQKKYKFIYKSKKYPVEMEFDDIGLNTDVCDDGIGMSSYVCFATKTEYEALAFLYGIHVTEEYFNQNIPTPPSWDHNNIVKMEF